MNTPHHPDDTSASHAPGDTHRQTRLALTLGALGVVFGDIGTSPLYTLSAVMAPGNGVLPVPADILGAISSLFWALMLVVTLKYVVLVLRADHRGEGGILALTALASRCLQRGSRWRMPLLLVGVLGAALFYGDSVITPAISVLGAVEGLKVVSPHLAPWVVPSAVLILCGLFAIQPYGTGRVGVLFGPVMALWFIVLAVVGVVQIVHNPAILAALDPRQMMAFLAGAGHHSLFLLGSVVLALTGAEALYADMGHFGRDAIRYGWVALVMPALVLNYLGQGALLLSQPAALENPFFHLFSDAWQLPAVLLATLASVIASQAVISGAFSLSQQAIQLGLLPRMRLRYTSEEQVGQIFVPAVNHFLLFAVLVVTLSFRQSAALASAYGIAVTITMFCTTALLLIIAHRRWRWPAAAIAVTLLPLLLLDGLLVAACGLKFAEGGWLPLLLGLLLFTVMTTWRRGREILLTAAPGGRPLTEALAELEARRDLSRCPRTAIFLTGNAKALPRALLHNLTHNQVLHERNVLLQVRFRTLPRLEDDERLRITKVSDRFWQVELSIGFMERPHVPLALLRCESHGLAIPVDERSYFLSREIVVPTPGEGMALWRERLFAFLVRNAESNVGYLRLPDEQVIVLSARVPI